jgi:hypothetical protein
MVTIAVCDECGRDWRATPGPRGAIPPRCPGCTADRTARRLSPVRTVPAPQLRRVRLCMRGCGRPSTSSRHWLCDRCRRPVPTPGTRRKRTRTHTQSAAARGYGNAHQALRRSWKKRIDRGELVPCGCGRCGQMIGPGTDFDMGHPNDDKTLTPTPWIRRHNRQFAAGVTQVRKRKQRTGRS